MYKFIVCVLIFISVVFSDDWQIFDKQCRLQNYHINFEYKDTVFSIVPFGFCEGYGCYKDRSKWSKIEGRSFLLFKSDSLVRVIEKLHIEYHIALLNKFGSVQTYLIKITRDPTLKLNSIQKYVDKELYGFSTDYKDKCGLNKFNSDDIIVAVSKSEVTFYGLQKGSCMLCGPAAVFVEEDPYGIDFKELKDVLRKK